MNYKNNRIASCLLLSSSSLNPSGWLLLIMLFMVILQQFTIIIVVDGQTTSTTTTITTMPLSSTTTTMQINVHRSENNVTNTTMKTKEFIKINESKIEVINNSDNVDFNQKETNRKKDASIIQKKRKYSSSQSSSSLSSLATTTPTSSSQRSTTAPTSSSLLSDEEDGIIIANRKPDPKSLRHRFEFVSNLKPIRTDETPTILEHDYNNQNITHILMPPNNHQQYRRTPTTFRPSSSVLYLHPPKPWHIDSMESVLTELNLTSEKIIVEWKLMVRLRNQNNILNDSNIIRRNSRNSSNIGRNGRRRNKRKVEAKVEEEQNPLRYNIYLRRYGFTDRQKYSIIDQNNTLDPPITKNQTYHYEMDGLKEMNAYEFCLQSVNAGEIHETDEIRQLFPVNAQTELAGRNNPLFLCKEIVMPAPSSILSSPSSKLISKTVSNLTSLYMEPSNGRDLTRIQGRSYNHANSSDNNKNGGGKVEVSDDATDAFVLYTAITSGSTTVLILVIVTIFCCCRCRRKVQKENHHQTLVYDRVQPSLSRDHHPHNIIVPYTGFRT